MLWRKRREGEMKSPFNAGLWPMSVSFPITLSQSNMQVSQVIMNALSETQPLFLPPCLLSAPLAQLYPFSHFTLLLFRLFCSVLVCLSSTSLIIKQSMICLFGEHFTKCVSKGQSVGKWRILFVLCELKVTDPTLLFSDSTIHFCGRNCFTKVF